MGRLYTFNGGSHGPWSITRITPVTGESLPLAARLNLLEEASDVAPEAAWSLRGIVSNERYTTRPEKDELVRSQSGLGRPEATLAALIPIRKSAAWWALTQDERRAIFEEQSRHVRIGMKALPPIARRLHHCRDLSESEPFDFLTFFDYAPAHAQAFEDMVGELRRTEEWKYVEREVDVRLVKSTPT
jgi:chlorite dismutase